jgi:catechol 2,3-dioxygenase-like lactoylglutathione lyase family enzyme
VSEWFSRPVLFVADIGRSVDFYVNQLGFTQSWRYGDEGKTLVAQVDRQGCALILSSLEQRGPVVGSITRRSSPCGDRDRLFGSV